MTADALNTPCPHGDPDHPRAHRYEATWAPDGNHDDAGGAP